MTYQHENGFYLLRLMPGEELMSSLEAFCKQHRLTGGFLSGLGAARLVEIGHFDVATKTYNKREFIGQHEVSNIVGNISAEKFHLHITISDQQWNTYSGHCFRCVTDPTLEIMITPFTELHRKKDEYSGLDLLDLSQSSESQ